MADFTWMQAEELLSPTALTVRAQTVDPTDQGRLLWDGFMPRRDVDQTKIASLSTQDVRVTADRREWNTRGRYIPLQTPPRSEIEWVPIESYFRIEEKEINDLQNEVRGNQALFREVVGSRIPSRTEELALANWRRLELDVMTAWANGEIKGGTTITFGATEYLYLVNGAASGAGTYGSGKFLIELYGTQS